jgi:hypothetical protein
VKLIKPTNCVCIEAIPARIDFAVRWRFREDHAEAVRVQQEMSIKKSHCNASYGIRGWCFWRAKKNLTTGSIGL